MTRLQSRLLQGGVHLGTVGVVWAVLAVVQWLLIGPRTFLDYTYLMLSTVAFLPFSLLLTNFVYHFAYAGETLDRKRLLDAGPNVAVLYTTYNDVLPGCLEETERAVEYPVDYWILSDSDDRTAIDTERKFGRWRRYTRENGRGGKCGIINDWLAEHGDEYEYFITLDADTMLAPGNVTRLVEHAEHPENADVGIFQTLKEVHPDLATTPFARIIGRGVKWSTRISPLVTKLVYGQNTYWGSAGLIRKRAVLDVGGYDEHLLCEDFVLTTKLDKAGWQTIVVDQRSYEGFPLDLHALRVRTVRWVRANRQMLPLLFSSDVSIGTRMNCLTPIMFYTVTPILLGLVVLATILPAFGDAAVPSAAFAALVFAFIFFHRGVVARRELRAFLATATLETLVVLGMSLRVTGALLLGRSVWIPSRKVSREFDWSESLQHTYPEVGFGLLLAGALIVRRHNPGLILLIGLWAGSFLSAPFILRYSSLASDTPVPMKLPHDPERGTKMEAETQPVDTRNRTS
ncbi:glycosyltransferase family 2 protein [Halalkalicoccus ordinarius]|uniref:glycosyltransferase family 2 protein n=1 Tax=Halalkalicoccus ordinarius TaxID=3116651 RepID=UPI00300F66D0